MLLNRLSSQSGCKVSLAGARASDQDDVVDRLQELAAV
jgi:hypothetical protein